MSVDASVWEAAGGDPQRLGLYHQIAEVAPLVTDEGRILASINPHHIPTGALGDLTGGVETIRAGEAWLAKRGCTSVRGPLEVATWFTYRANLGPFEEPAFLFEPSATSEPWLDAGYEVCARYTSAIITNDEAIAYGEEKRPDGYAVRPMGGVEETLRLIHDISHAGFVDAYAFSPLPYPALKAWYEPMLARVEARMVVIAEKDRQPVGFIFGIPDLSNPNSGRFIAKSMATLPETRGHGLGAWLIGELHRVAADMGFTEGIHALMWAGSHSTKFTGKGRGRVIREYALYEKSLG